MSSYWRLLAALLAGGMDPAIALNEGSPVVNSMVVRAEMMTGQDLAKSRILAAHAILLVGGYHVFGEALMTELSPSQDHDEAIVNLQNTMLKLMHIASNEK
jgi:hypothetical protein